MPPILFWVNSSTLNRKDRLYVPLLSDRLLFSKAFFVATFNLYNCEVSPSLFWRCIFPFDDGGGGGQACFKEIRSRPKMPCRLKEASTFCWHLLTSCQGPLWPKSNSMQKSLKASVLFYGEEKMLLFCYGDGLLNRNLYIKWCHYWMYFVFVIIKDAIMPLIFA